MESTREGGVPVYVAGFWRRAAAGVVDLLVLALTFVVLDAAVSLALGLPLPRWRQLSPDYLLDVAVNGDGPVVIALIVLGMIAFFYLFVFQATAGQTPGMRLVHIKVIDGYGQRPSLGRALIRTAAYAPSLLLFLAGFLWIGFDREKRGLHDWLADTYVVRGPA
jgi:uncharacterized RDD family membrane protein YckC